MPRNPTIYIYKWWHLLLPPVLMHEKYESLTGAGINKPSTARGKIEKYVSVIPVKQTIKNWLFIAKKWIEKNDKGDEQLKLILENYTKNNGYENATQLLEIWQNAFLIKADTKYFLFQAEAGMGKTLTMQKAFVELSRIGAAKAFVFVYCQNDTNQQILQIKETLRLQKIEQKDTIIFIDALDEDSKARKNEEERFKEITNQVAYFKKIFISVRREFLKNEDVTRFAPVNQNIFQFVITANDIDEKFINNYIDSVFSITNFNFARDIEEIADLKLIFQIAKRKKDAKRIIDGKEKTLYYRPLFLTSLLELTKDTETTKKYQYAYQIYQYLLQVWTERQEQKPTRQRENNEHKARVNDFKEDGKKLALYTYRQNQKSLSVDLLTKISKYKDNAKDRLFFVRNNSNQYEFAHQAFRDYFLVEALLKFELTEEEFFYRNPSEDLISLYKEGLHIEKAIDKTIIDNLEKLEILFGENSDIKNALSEIPKNCHLTILCHTHKQFLTNQSHFANDEELVKSLLPVVEETEKQHYIFKNYKLLEEYKNATDISVFIEKLKEDYHFRFLVARYVIEKIIVEKQKTPYLQLQKAISENFDLELIAISEEFDLKLQKAIAESTPEEQKKLSDKYNKKLQKAITERLKFDFSAMINILATLSEFEKESYEYKTVLNLSNLGIADTDWAKYFPNLITLNLNNNNFIYDHKNPCPIQEILFFKDNRNRKLKTLKLHNNPIKEHPFFEKLFADNKNNRNYNYLEIVRPIAGLTFVEGGIFTQGMNPKDERLDEYNNLVISDSDKANFSDAVYPHKVKLSDYHIGKYQITVGNFRAFIKDSEYMTYAEREELIYDPTTEKGEDRLVKKRGSYISNWNEGKNEIEPNTKWDKDIDGKPQKNESCPVIHLSWYDCEEYCKWLSKKVGFEIKLPSESQWEYAAKGGKQQYNYDYAGSNNIGDVAQYGIQYFKRDIGERQKKIDPKERVLLPVGTKKPIKNLDTYDMSGNVWEWCQDDYNSTLYKSRFDKQEVNKKDIELNPIQENTDEEKIIEAKKYLDDINSKYTFVDSITIKVLRGGSWYDYSAVCLVAYRDRNYTSGRSSSAGFRICSPSIV